MWVLAVTSAKFSRRIAALRMAARQAPVLRAATPLIRLATDAVYSRQETKHS